MNILTNLAIKNNKKNRTRSILVMIAIFLTTLLLAVIATFGYGSVKSQKENAGSLYGTFYGSYRNVSEEQLEKMQARGEFSQIGISASVGEIENPLDMSLMWVDKAGRELTNIDKQLEIGKFAQKANEITAGSEFFEQLGYDHAKPGDKIILKARKSRDEKYQQQEFVISGILKKQKSEVKTKSFFALVSKKYYEQQISKEQRRYAAYVRLNDSVNINYDNAESVLKDLAKKCGISPKWTDVNSYYIMWSLDPGTETIGMCAMIAVLVIVFSVAVIYHIFQVGIAQKIQEYGKIKSLGASKKQMKKIVFREGMTLAAISVPLGLVAGYFLTDAVFSILMEKSMAVINHMEYKEVSLFSIPVLFFCGMLAVVTVWVALKRPMKIVSKISPMEAMRFQEGKTSKMKTRKNRQIPNVRRLTLSNLKKYRSRTIMTILTMGLSCVLFVTLGSIAYNIDPQYDAKKKVEHGKFAIILDYSTNDEAYPENNLDAILKKKPLGDAAIQQIKKLDGVTKVQARKYLVMKEKNQMSSVAVLSKEDFEKEKSDGGVGTLSYEKASKENGILYGWKEFLEDDGYHIDQKINAVLEDGEKESSYYGKIQGAFGSIESKWAITEDTFQKMKFSESSNGVIWVDCKEKDCEKVQKELEKFVSRTDHVEMESFADALKVSEMSAYMLQISIYAFLLIIGVICFMNMANTMIISIITRKQEIGILQAIGMTNKQLNWMLQIEGLLFTMGTIAVSLGIGIPAGYGCFRYASTHGIFGMNQYRFPWIPILVMVAILAILQITLSYILSKNVKKESLIDRIRYQD